jgi:putative heme-binding domain-containing protein
MAPTLARAYVGASGFSYASWRPDFYPADAKPEEFLRLYSERLPTVELNASFYRMTAPEQYARWAAETPPGFRFAVTMSRSVTARGTVQRADEFLASVAARRSDLLLVDILDPSQQVLPDYVSYLAVTKDGRVLTGLIAAETAESVTLRREEGQQETLPRSKIDQFRASGKSLMPDGLEQKLTPDQMADLLEFLHHPDVYQLN